MPYITPQADPPDTSCRRIFIPNDNFMVAAIMGQILELTEANNWEQTTGISIADTTALWETIYAQFSEGFFCLIGAIIPILNDVIPSNMLLCDGSTFNKIDFPELYDVLPAVLISNPSTGLTPDLRDMFVVAASATILEHSTGGSDTHTLLETEMPSHAHLYDKETFNIDIESVGIPDPTGVGLPHIPTLTSSAGGDGAHNNMPPYYSLKYVVVAK